MTNRFQHVLFDLDGTLANSLGVMQETYFAFLKSFGTEGSLEEFNQLNGPSLKEIVAYLCEKYKIPVASEAVIEKYLDQLTQAYAAGALPAAGADSLLHELRKQDMTVTLVTSSARTLVEAFIAQHNWQPHFKITVSGDDVAQSKPHPAIYLLALERLGASAASAVAVEDSVNGVRSASSAGICVIAVNANTHEHSLLQEAGANYVVNDLHAVRDILVGVTQH